MKKYLVFVLLFVFLVTNSFGLPLVYKTQKEIKANGVDYVEIAILDVSRFKEIRIGAVLVGADSKEVNSKVIRLEAIEGEDLIYLGSTDVSSILPTNSIEMKNLPNRIKISVADSGTYRIYVWAQ